MVTAHVTVLEGRGFGGWVVAIVVGNATAKRERVARRAKEGDIFTRVGAPGGTERLKPAFTHVLTARRVPLRIVLVEHRNHRSIDDRLSHQDLRLQRRRINSRI